MAFSKLRSALFSLNWLTGKPTNWQEIWQPEKTLCREQRWLRLLRRASEVASERDECRTDGRMRWEVEKDRRVESFSDRREATRLLLLLLLCDAHCSAEIHSISVCKGRPEVQKARNPEDQKSRRPNGQKSRWPWSVGWFSDNQSQLQPDILYAVLKCYFYGKVKGNSIVATGNITLLDIGCR